ncbi:hypothetical protein VTL71DRAFT_5456 [Oculimacula yallundae]|uniref:Uncharacterized protein n=1 Tax=Oculimacula yallundae TaxID=86028 RepID=A0ABR4C2B6_9HELO
MDTKQEQTEGLLTSLDAENRVDDPVHNNDRGNYELNSNTFRGRKIVGILPWALHLTVFLGYVVYIVTRKSVAPPESGLRGFYDGLVIKEQFHETSMTSPFQGRPNKTSEEAWHHMLSVGIVSITEEENSRLPFKTAPNFFKENEYVVELNIFHQLQCLYGLRQQLYNSRHLDWKNNEAVTFWEFHMNHCIEHLRETLMCNADITPQRFDWDEASRNYILDRHQQFPICKNWADIWNWAEGRNTTGDTPMNIGELAKPVQ